VRDLAVILLIIAIGMVVRGFYLVHRDLNRLLSL